MNTMDNIAYSALRAGDTTSYAAPARTKSASPKKKKRMYVEEYFGKVWERYLEKYENLQS